jgi:hypothetical protein
MTYVLAHLVPLGALVAAVGMGGFALERLLARRLPAEAAGDAPLPRELRALLRAVLGVVLWMAVLFALACAGALGRWTVWGLAAACAAGAAWAWPRREPAGSPREPGAVAFVAVALLFTLPLSLVALSWDVSWDASTYHLTLPRLWVEAGGFTAPPGNVYARWPLATELLYAAALAVADHPVAKALHGAFGLATLWALWVGARSFDREAAAWIAAPLVLASPVVLLEWSIAYVDLAYAFFFLAGLLFVARWRETRGADRRALVWAGVCGGALAGVKVNGVVGAAALGMSLLPALAAQVRRGGGRGALADAARFALPVLVLWLPWLARTALLTGNPLYPLFFDVFGGPDWSPRLAEQFLAWQRSIGMGREPLDYLLLPWRVATRGGPGYAAFDGAIGAHWLAVVPLALLGWRRPLVRSALLACAVYFALWALGSQQARFLVPILPPLALAGAIGTLEGVDALTRDERLRLGAAAGIAALAGALALHSMQTPTGRAITLLPRFAHDGAELKAAAIHPVHRFVATLPPDAKLLLMNTNQGFFLSRPYEADSFFEASQIADRMRDAHGADEAHAQLVSRGITHVLRARRSWGIDWPEGLSALLADEELARRRFRSDDGRYEIFALAPRPAPDPR